MLSESWQRGHWNEIVLIMEASWGHEETTPIEAYPQLDYREVDRLDNQPSQPLAQELAYEVLGEAI